MNFAASGRLAVLFRRLVSPLAAGHLQNRLLLVILVATVAVVGADALNVRGARLDAMRLARRDQASLARALAEQTHGLLQTLDTVLVGLQERAEVEGASAAGQARLRRFMAIRAANLPLLHRLLVLDQAGRIVIASGSPAPVTDMFPAHRMLLTHAARTGRALLLGWPMRDPIDGTWVLPVSRRTDAADGSFGGMVLASIALADLERSFVGLDSGTGSVVLLARADGVMLARYPPDPRGPAADVSHGDLFHKIAEAGGVGQASFTYRSGVDGLIRFGSVDRVADAPALVLIARSQDDVLDGWRGMALAHAVALLAVLALMGVLGWRLARKISEEQRAQAVLLDTHRRLASSEAGIARANRWLEMAEQIAQVGHFRYEPGPPPLVTWSDEVFRLHGRDRSSVPVSAADSIAAYHPDDQAEVSAAYSRALSLGAPFEFTARILRPDGSVRHILSRGLPQTNARGVPTGIFGVCVDITQQKRDEAALREARARAEAANLALEAANRALEGMAMQDALTGLANRRHFDRALDLEFRRALRAGSSLALVLIDVDRFKQYNDTYGHQAGDACLRALGGVIPSVLNRAGDTVARYGGEEIVVLLPGNTLAGAVEMAHRIADEIRALAIAHTGSHHGVVTISAGVEAFVPVRDRDTAAALVEHADVALYAAKRAGRACVMTFDDVGVEKKAVLF